ncbi:MAG TPA: primosomal protein N', partial [Afifellaceae bacterium]|nr:primosomal protein N' [Afifellaceae bacterium]
GVVWPAEDEPVDAARLREIEQVFDTPPLPEVLIGFIDWVADYTLSPRGMLLRMVLRAPGALEPEKPMMGVRLAGPPPQRMTAARRRILETAANGLAWSKSGLAAAAGVSPGVIDGLVKHGTMEVVAIPARQVAGEPDLELPPAYLTDAQEKAAAQLVELVKTGAYGAALLDGVTGSGKTEAYFEAVAQAFRAGKQVLILLPEIALTGAFLDRFTARFGARPGEWHSDMATKMRNRVWRGVLAGEVRAVVGARSALFLPFADLGLIIVDEEHDGAFKQEDGVIYHARDMAVVRASLGGFPIVLSSATPSVESRVNAMRGRYAHVHLPARFGGGAPPVIAAIDLRAEPPERGRWLSPLLVKAIEATLKTGEQSLLFLNRRGYAPLTLCRTCGFRMSCPNCAAWLVEHRFRGVLACHHCGHDERRPEACPHCGDSDSLTACGPGVERLEEEVLERFGEARTLVMSSDMAGGVQRLRLELEAIRRGEADIIVGTQLVAKGHNFPGLSLVGVVDADLGLAQGDPRAAERTFQLLTQVTGRAGRAGQESRAFLQTHAPNHPVIQALVSGDSERFYEQESAMRRQAGLPPFGRLAGIVISAADRGDAESHARAMARAAPADEQIRLLGPAEAPIAVLRGRYRFRLLVQAQSSAALHGWLNDWLAKAPKARGS